MTYTDEQVSILRQTPITEVLASFPSSLEHRGKMYFSPFRDERTPSFLIDESKHHWCDFGAVDEKRGGYLCGDAIELVRIKKDWRRDEEYVKALDYLAELNPSVGIAVRAMEQARIEFARKKERARKEGTVKSKPAAANAPAPVKEQDTILREAPAYTKELENILRETPITEVLASFSSSLEHTDEMYFFSPFRDERTPSFFVDESKHHWCDFGAVDEERGGYLQGDVIELVRIKKDWRRKEDYVKALDYLAELNPSVGAAVRAMEQARNEFTRKEEHARKEGAVESKLTVTKVSPKVWSDSLKAYAASRCISPDLLNRYCSQVHYSRELIDVSTGEITVKNYFAIGFPNSSGGWALRNPYMKLSTGAGVTLVHGDGTVDVSPSPERTYDSLVVFEGFFDFLAWLGVCGRDVPGKFDVLVLNSVSNIHKAREIISSYPKVLGYLDNDRAGDANTATLENMVKEAGGEFVDRRGNLSGSNDVNDAWMKICEERKRETLSRTPDKGEGYSPTGLRP